MISPDYVDVRLLQRSAVDPVPATRKLICQIK
jgi:hypothetical protein